MTNVCGLAQLWARLNWTHRSAIVLYFFQIHNGFMKRIEIQEGQNLTRELFKKNDYIFFEGDKQAHFYIVEEGEVLIFMMNEKGEKIDITVIHEGEQFGEFALLDNAPRSASAIALSDCSLIRVSEAGYEALLAELPNWSVSILRNLVARLKHQNDLLKGQPQFFDEESTRGS
jgi:CRP/FNR family transcriptional regulator, cyclic AMP receptor protein